jgi:hypothetical protein
MSVSTEESEDQNFWPGYVDAISNLVLSLLFVTMILAMALLTSSQSTKKSDQNSDTDSPEKKLYKLQEESAQLEKVKQVLKSQAQQSSKQSDQESQSKVSGKSKTDATVEVEGDPLRRKEIDMNAPGVQFLEVQFSKDTFALGFPDDVNFRNTVRGLGGDPSKWYYRLETLAESGDRVARKQGFARLAAIRAQLIKTGVPLHLVDLHVTEVADPQQANTQKVQVSRIPYKWGNDDARMANGAPLEDLAKAQADIVLAPVEVKFGAGSTSLSDSEQGAFKIDSRKLGADLVKGRYQVRARVQPGSATARRQGFFRISSVRELLVRQGVPFDSVDIHVAEVADISPDDVLKIIVTRVDQPSLKSGDAIRTTGSAVPADAKAGARPATESQGAAVQPAKVAAPLAVVGIAFKADASALSDAEKEAFKQAAAGLGADLAKGRYQIRARVAPDSASARRVAFFRVSAIREQLVKLGIPFDAIDLNIADAPGITPEESAKPTIARLQ